VEYLTRNVYLREFFTESDVPITRLRRHLKGRQAGI
jgi:hypothetical protein